MSKARFLPLVASASIATFSLFYMMQSLVKGADIILDAPLPDRNMIFIQEEIKPPVVRKIERIPKPMTVIDPPRKTKPKKTIKHNKNIIVISGPPIPTGPSGARPTLLPGQMDGERIPLVRVAPPYPRRCQDRGISGWVVMDFDVSALGMVENPILVDADPSGCFNRTALKTILRFKYKPTIVDGIARASKGVRFRMVFEMPSI